MGASPEMFVRVEHNDQGWRCETCPISGTIRRGRDALEDAENIKQILSDKKEESELTMCTDVDRNDKSRICKAGSVQVTPIAHYLLWLCAGHRYTTHYATASLLCAGYT